LIGSYDDAPAASNFLSQYKNLLHHYIHQTSNEEASTFWGACGAIRRDVFLKMGGFDESYGRPSIEDIELGYRLKRAGYQIRLRKSLQVKHLKRWTARSLVQTDFFQRALPWSRLLLQDAKNGSDFGNDLNLQASSRISALLVLLLPGALAFTPWFGIAGITAFTATITLLWLNLPLYRFLQRKRGIGFALRTIPWHWFYYFYSSLALGFAYLEKLFTNNTRSFFANNSFSPDRKSRKE
jgi:cellulose synthase/poly-beta-1,6-N-acetylglucosamine synthase-like glycosyltransferase